MEFITLQTLDGNSVHVRRDAIVSMRTARSDKDKRVITERAHCALTLIDGKFLAVDEECDNIRQRMDALKKE